MLSRRSCSPVETARVSLPVANESNCFIAERDGGLRRRPGAKSRSMADFARHGGDASTCRGLFDLQLYAPDRSMDARVHPGQGNRSQCHDASPCGEWRLCNFHRTDYGSDAVQAFRASRPCPICDQSRALTALVLIPLSYLVLRSESLPKSSSESPDLGSPRIGLSALLRNNGFRIYAGSIFLAFISFFAIQSNVAPYLADLGAGSAGVATVLASMSLASVAGKLVAGVLADRLDNRLLFGAASGLSAIGAFLLMGTPAFEQALCAFIALGFGFGAYLPLNSSLAIRIFGAQNVATILGALSLVVTFCAMFPALAGLIRDRVGSYDLALAVGGASALCSIALISMLKVTVPTWTGDTSAGEK